jgi:hypothetical protein
VVTTTAQTVRRWIGLMHLIAWLLGVNRSIATTDRIVDARSASFERPNGPNPAGAAAANRQRSICAKLASIDMCSPETRTAPGLR